MTASVAPPAEPTDGGPALDSWLRVVLCAGLVAAAVTLSMALALTFLWQPTTGATFTQVSDRGLAPALSAVHRVGSLATAVACAVALALVARAAVRAQATPSAIARVVGLASITVVAALVGSITRAAVQWDQLALWAVTVGTDIQGYWSAAFDSDVRFVLIDLTEISQREYRIALAVHLAAPIVTAVGLGVLALEARRLRSATGA